MKMSTVRKSKYWLKDRAHHIQDVCDGAMPPNLIRKVGYVISVGNVKIYLDTDDDTNTISFELDEYETIHIDITDDLIESGTDDDIRKWFNEYVSEYRVVYLTNMVRDMRNDLDFVGYMLLNPDMNVHDLVQQYLETYENVK